jgi:NADH:ubiquinone oxidoreductase subunit 6 (subunit J)
MKSILLEILIINSIASAILVIIAKNPVVSVIFLISLVLNAALFLITKGLSYIGIAYILIYLGAVIVLFLFVIMMININLVEIIQVGQEYTKNIPLALTVSGLFLYEFFNLGAFNSLVFSLFSDRAFMSIDPNLTETLSPFSYYSISLNNDIALSNDPLLINEEKIKSLALEKDLYLYQLLANKNEIGLANSSFLSSYSMLYNYVSSIPKNIFIIISEIINNLYNLIISLYLNIYELFYRDSSLIDSQLEYTNAYTFNSELNMPIQLENESIDSNYWLKEMFSDVNVRNLIFGANENNSTLIINLREVMVNFNTLLNNNFPETFIVSFTHVVSVAQNIYTNGSFLFIILGFVLLLAMVAPIYLSRSLN